MTFYLYIRQLRQNESMWTVTWTLERHLIWHYRLMLFAKSPIEKREWLREQLTIFRRFLIKIPDIRTLLSYRRLLCVYELDEICRINILQKGHIWLFRITVNSGNWEKTPSSSRSIHTPSITNRSPDIMYLSTSTFANTVVLVPQGLTISSQV